MVGAVLQHQPNIAAYPPFYGDAEIPQNASEMQQILHIHSSLTRQNQRCTDPDPPSQDWPGSGTSFPPPHLGPEVIN